MMRVPLNLDDVANRVAEPWPVLVVLTMLIVPRSPAKLSNRFVEIVRHFSASFVN